MKKLALVLALAPLATQAGSTNPYVRDHEAYASWHPLVTQVGSVVALVVLTMNHWTTSSKVNGLLRAVRAADAWKDDPEWAQEYRFVQQHNERAGENEKIQCLACLEGDRPLLSMHGDERHYMCPPCIKEHRAKNVKYAYDANLRPIRFVECPGCRHHLNPDEHIFNRVHRVLGN